MTLLIPLPMFFTADRTAHNVIKKVIFDQLTLLNPLSMFFTADRTAHTVIKKVIFDQMTSDFIIHVFLLQAQQLTLSSRKLFWNK